MLNIFKKNNKKKCAQCHHELDKENVIKKFSESFCSSVCSEEYAKEKGIVNDMQSCCHK